MGYTVIRNGRLHDNFAHAAPPADVLIDGSRIVEVGPPGLAAPPEAAVIDASERLLIPGLVNAHTHGHGAIGKGIGDGWPLELLLNAGPWINGGRTLEHKYLSAKVGALEMLSKGCTTCYDLYFEFPGPSREGMEAAARAYQDAGMRVVMAPMCADRTFFEAIPGLLDALPANLRTEVERAQLNPAETTLSTLKSMLEHWSLDRDWARPALAPTIPLHCSDGFITRNRDLAKDYGVGLHMHLAESKFQAVAGMQRYGKTLTAHLADLGFLGENFTGAHCVWLDPDDIARIGDAGGAIAHNPGSNLRLGSGIAAAKAMAEAGVNVGIGTDGSQCSDNQNVFEATRLASFVSHTRDHDPSGWLQTHEVFDMATRGGAKVTGFGADIGRIEAGAFADIVFIDLEHLNYWPLNDPTNQLVHVEDGSAVHSVMTGGQMVLEDGKFVREDMAALKREVDQAAEFLGNANRERRALAESLSSVVGQFCVGLASHPYHVHAMSSVGERH